MDETVTDEELMAFADGMLEPGRTAELQTAIAKDHALAARVAMFRDSAALLADLGQAQPADVPDDLIARVRELSALSQPAGEASGSVIDLSARRRARQVPFWQVPLAASIFLTAGILGTLALRPGDKGESLQLAALETAPVQEALRDMRSGEERRLGQGRIAMIATFTNRDDELCREFEYDPSSAHMIVSVACHRDGEWQVRMAVAAAAVDATGYAPASSLEVLDTYLTATGAAAPLGEDEEAAALKRLP